MFPSLFNKKDKPVKIKFLFDTEAIKKRFTVFDKITFEHLQGGVEETERLVILMSHFMVDEKNEPISEEKGISTIVRLNQIDYADVAKKFIEAMQEVAIPKASGSSSNLPSDRGQEVPLPPGQQP